MSGFFTCAFDSVDQERLQTAERNLTVRVSERVVSGVLTFGFRIRRINSIWKLPRYSIKLKHIRMQQTN